MDKILAATDSSFPDYIQSSQNPADVASRGIRPKQKKEYQLWSQGPSFLKQDSSCWQVGMRHLQPKINQIDVDAEISASGLKINPIQVEESSFIMHFLSNSASCMEAEKTIMMLKMCIIALRFHQSSFDAQNKVCTSRESARHLLVKMAQEETMGKVIWIMRDSKLNFEEALKRFPSSEQTSSLLQLVKYIPFLDGNGILRIGGRLSQCDLAYNSGIQSSYHTDTE